MNVLRLLPRSGRPLHRWVFSEMAPSWGTQSAELSQAP